ncbi:MAG: FAD-dependent oxidoreductase, partial [Gemmatimonadota bacterium]|nr:FAD-dependent oxidoreductase [Gemmatimonadota bacterium]
MTRRLNPLSDRPVDVLIIGGGIVGACAARDAARRGLAVALIDRQDFGSGISWNSLKIVHGGLRSLQGLDVVQARQFVRERRAWLHIAPHLVEPLPFVVPTRGHGGESAMLVRAGLALNDLVSSDRNEGISESRQLPRGRALSRAELRTLVPNVFDDYPGGAMFFDAQLYSAERLVQSVLDDAVCAGAFCASYVEAVAPLRASGSLQGAVAEDRLTGDRFDVRASMIINAAGAGAAAVADMLIARSGTAPPMTGIALNLMLDGDEHSTAFALAAKLDGRLRRLFVVPWRGRTLVGTAHYECARTPQSAAELEPFVECFVSEVALAWPSRAITRERVLLVHSGMQPSPHGTADTKAHGPPDHLIVDHARDGVPQLLTAIGPKLTTSRAMAEQLIDIVATRVPRTTAPCDTASQPLVSAPGDDVTATVASALRDERAGLPDDVVAHLVRWYGSNGYDAIVRLVREEPALGARVEEGAPVINAQLRYGARVEGATSVEDLIDRRTELGGTARGGARARVAA